jgi:sugar/nucleoside kinase (ribokinase family)
MAKAKKERGLKIQVLGDLIADISMRLPQFPVKAKDIHRLSYMEVGPGGACNVAIMAARFGLDVGVIGEVGDDGFGLVVREGLKREGVDVKHLRVTSDADTPVAGVVVDRSSEPGYLGYPGSLKVREFQKAWHSPIEGSKALFADGWAEYPEIPAMLLEGFALARKAGVTTFFDPGPGNPDVDNAWMPEIVALSSVVLLNRAEARRVTEEYQDNDMVKVLQGFGAEFIVLKRGAQGLLLVRGEARVEVPGFSIKPRDATGAGDSLAGAAIYGVLHDMPLEKLAVLANATGAAKVQKLGTGHNMPTIVEIAAVLEANGYEPDQYLPRSNA